MVEKETVGINYEMEYFRLNDFDLITQFNNKSVISRLGAATSDIAEQELPSKLHL